jgi:hypothetical protein
VASARLTAAVALVTLVSSATAVAPAAAGTDRTVVTHHLIVGVEKNMAPAAEKKLAFLVLLRRDGGPPAGAVVTAAKPLTVLLAGGLYRVRVEVDSPCKGTCDASRRVSGAVDHRLEVVPRCRAAGPGFVCSTIEIVQVY